LGVAFTALTNISQEFAPKWTSDFVGLLQGKEPEEATEKEG
jgi:hypothetical protein